ncbi:MAG: TIGR02710 family CRISPR-associated CARF protein [candidate division WOR-3 bacterium]
MAKAVLISVGGSQNPIIFSLKEQKPEYIIFFASSQSQEQIPQILQQIGFTPKAFEQIVTPLAEDLNECYKTIKKNLTDIIERWKLNTEDIVVDFTGGTKTMSVALTLATIDLGFKYAYVGGTERNKEGLGVVIDGKEKILYSTNPWDVLAVEERKRVNTLFNTGRYKTCLEILDSALKKVSETQKPFYQMLKILVEGYFHWNRCNIETALEFLGRGYNQLKIYVAGTTNHKFEKLLCEIKNNLDFVKKIVEGNKRLLIFDLLGSAKRCAELEHKYDDAVARIYRALEKIAQVELENLGIKDNDVKPAQIPENMREEFIKRYQQSDGKIQLPLYAKFRLLKEKDNTIGHRFFKNEQEIRSMLELRNYSKLAHGDRSLTENDYKNFYSLICNTFNITDEEIPKFPYFDI